MSTNAASITIIVPAAVRIDAEELSDRRDFFS